MREYINELNKLNTFQEVYNWQNKITTEINKSLGTITDDRDQKEVRTGLENAIKHKSFYLEYDLKNHEIVWSSNAYALLGAYDVGQSNEKDFCLNYKNFAHRISQVHIRYYKEFVATAIATYSTLKENKKFKKDAYAAYQKRKQVQEYHSVVFPIKHFRHDRILIFEQVAIPMGFDKNRNMITHINQYILRDEVYNDNFKIKLELTVQNWGDTIKNKIPSKIGEIKHQLNPNKKREISKNESLSERAKELLSYYCNTKTPTRRSASEFFTNKYPEKKGWSLTSIDRLNKELITHAMLKCSDNYIKNGIDAARFLCTE